MGNNQSLESFRPPAERWSKHGEQPIVIHNDNELNKATSLMDWYQFESDRRNCHPVLMHETKHISELSRSICRYTKPNIDQDELDKCVVDGINFANKVLPRNPWLPMEITHANKWSGGEIININGQRVIQSHIDIYQRNTMIKVN